MACAIQPTERPRANRLNALPSGNLRNRRNATSAKSMFGGCPVNCSTAVTSSRASGKCGKKVRQQHRGPRVAFRIERMTKARQRLIGCEAPAQIDRQIALAEAAPERFDPRRHAAVSATAQCSQTADHRGAQAGAGRGDTAGRETRRVQFMIGAKHQRHADQIGALAVQSPGLGQLPMQRRRARAAQPATQARQHANQSPTAFRHPMRIVLPQRRAVVARGGGEQRQQRLIARRVLVVMASART